MLYISTVLHLQMQARCLLDDDQGDYPDRASQNGYSVLTPPMFTFALLIPHLIPHHTPAEFLEIITDLDFDGDGKTEPSNNDASTYANS